MTESQTEKPIDKIKKYLNQFDWKPESIVEKDDQYTITLLVEVEDESYKITVKLADNSKWIYFSAKFMSGTPQNRKLEIYKKLLELNFDTTLSKFGLAPSGSIYIMIELPLPELNYSEFISALRRLVNDINSYKDEIAKLEK